MNKWSEKYFGKIIWALLIVVLLLAGMNVYRTIRFTTHNVCNMTDVHARWQESYYLLKGYVPNQIPDSMIDERVGTVQEDMISTPWTWSMGILFHMPWLEWEMAKTITMLVMWLIFFATAAVVFFSVYEILGDYKGTFEGNYRWLGACIAGLLILADGSLYYNFRGGELRGCSGRYRSHSRMH